MLKELFGKALCKNKKQEARRKDKLNREKWKGNLLTVEMGAKTKINKKKEENFEQEKFEGEYTGWQTSHTPLYGLLEIKKLENEENAPLTLSPCKKS